MDQSVAIQETLTTEENCVIAVECVSLLDGVKNSRLLGLVHYNNEHAIFIYCHRRMPITGDDVTLDDIVPISYDFSVVEVSSPDELAVLGADTRVRVTYLAEELELRLPFGSQARLFLSEVNRAWSDACEQYPEVKPKFDWLAKYRKVSKGARSFRKSLPSLTSRSSVMSRSKRSAIISPSVTFKERSLFERTDRYIHMPSQCVSMKDPYPFKPMSENIIDPATVACAAVFMGRSMTAGISGISKFE